MPTIPSGYANIAIPFIHGGTSHVSYITFGVDNNTGLTAPSVVADAVWDAFHAEVRPVLDNSITLGPPIASVNGGSGVVTGEGTSSDIGGAGLASVPMNCALLVAKITATPGREGKGRYYIPFALEESDVSETGVIDGTTVTDHQAVQDDFLAALTAENVPMVLLHDGAGTPAPVTQLIVRPKIGTQRRRLRG